MPRSLTEHERSSTNEIVQGQLGPARKPTYTNGQPVWRPIQPANGLKRLARRGVGPDLVMLGHAEHGLVFVE